MYTIQLSTLLILSTPRDLEVLINIQLISFWIVNYIYDVWQYSKVLIRLQEQGEYWQTTAKVEVLHQSSVKYFKPRSDLSA